MPAVEKVNKGAFSFFPFLFSAFLLFSSFQPGKAKATERYHLLKILAKRRFFSGTKRKPQMEVSLFKDQRFFSLANFWMALCFIIKLLLQLGNILSSHTKTPHVTQPLNSVNPSSSFTKTVSQLFCSEGRP